MVLSMPGGLFKQDDVRETATSELTSGERVPIGAILPWLKTYASTPTLPTGFVECAGQVLNDPESVYDGQTIPNLNASKFLRGATTSGGTGGSSTHILSIAEIPSHKHGIMTATQAGSGGQWCIYNDGTYEDSWCANAGGGAAHENKPPYYNVVWIMRIK